MFFNLLNGFVVNPLMLLPLYMINHKIEHNMDYQMPKPHIFFLQVVFCLIIEDLIFYISHNAMHTSLIYPKIHKIHHEYKVPISISALHVHPLEFVFGNVIP
jgi:sterol desaturase/sphingolipid hydroxylase (fatty acid hydroxylase superfamily)